MTSEQMLLVTLVAFQGLCLHLQKIFKTEDMKISIFVLLVIIIEFTANSLASPPKGGIGDGYIYPVKSSSASKPKSTTTYYAKPLHPPARKPSRPAPKAKIYKVIIQNQPAAQSQKQEEIFKIIQLNGGNGGGGGGHGGAGGGGSGSNGGKSVKIVKIIHVKQQPNGGGGGSGGHGSGGHGSGGHGSGGWSK